MGTLLSFVHLLALGVWNGGLILLFVVVMPVLYAVLSDDLGARVIERLLPAYYAFALACGATSLASLVAIHAAERGAVWFGWRCALIVGMTLLTGVAARVVQPRIQAILRGLPEVSPQNGHHPEFRRLIALQRTAQQINGGVLLLGLTALWLTVGGPELGG